jgi:hypothetical protein
MFQVILVYKTHQDQTKNLFPKVHQHKEKFLKGFLLSNNTKKYILNEDNIIEVIITSELFLKKLKQLLSVTRTEIVDDYTIAYIKI